MRSGASNIGRSGSHLALASFALAAMLSSAACKKEKRTAGGKNGPKNPAPVELPPMPQVPPDATALLGFVATTTPPDAAAIRAAAVALTGDQLVGPEVDALFDSCVVPVTASLRRSTIVFLSHLDDERTVALAEGRNLRAALEPCLLKIAAEMTDQPEPARQEGRLTLYPSDENMLVAAWTGADRVVLGMDRADVELVLDSRGPLTDAALAGELAAVDPSAPVWFVAGSKSSPPRVHLVSMRAHLKGLRGEGHMVFGVDGIAEEAAEELTGELKGAIQTRLQGRELHLEGELARVLTTLRPRRRDGTDPPPAPLDDKHVRTLLGSGPMMLALFLVAVGGGESKPATATPRAVAPPPPAVAPAPPPAPPPPAPPGP